MSSIIELVRETPETSFVDILKQKSVSGLIMELGVFQGHTINIIADTFPEETVYGFDSFEGLPEDWFDLKKGHFKCDIPTVKDNVKLVHGYFQDSIPKFLEVNSELISIVHIDCDLYSSTKCIFDLFCYRFQVGSIIIFDELYDYTGWENHEYKAFNEFLESTGYKAECIGKYNAHQAGFKLYV